MVDNLKKTTYDLLGGEVKTRLLVERFYFYMDTLPETSDIRKKHEPDLSIAKEKLFKFLSGWLGGPDLFIQEYGHPMLRRRHFKFVIGDSDKDQWMMCMTMALTDMDVSEAIKNALLMSFDQLALRMINQE